MGRNSFSLIFLLRGPVFVLGHENDLGKLGVIVGFLQGFDDGLERHKRLLFAVEPLLLQVIKDMDSSLVELSFVDLAGEPELEADALSKEFAPWSLKREVSLERILGLRIK